MIIRAANETELEELAELQRLKFRPDEPDAAQRFMTYTKEDEAAFWHNLLGDRPFYSWTDIFYMSVCPYHRLGA